MYKGIVDRTRIDNEKRWKKLKKLDKNTEEEKKCIK